jgi:hypothetical protein
MDINSILLTHGNKTFKADTEDELGVFMHVGEYKIHVRKDDASLAMGMLVNEFHPLIDSFEKI